MEGQGCEEVFVRIMTGMSIANPTTRGVRVRPIDAVAHAVCDRVAGREPGRAMGWKALHTKSRQEKSVAERLARVGARQYLPLVRKVRVYGHRRRVVEAPLFPGYLFLWGGADEVREALDTGGVVRAIAIADQARVERELAQVRRALEAGASLELFPYLERGRAVRVTAGPFKGLEGIVEEARGGDRLILRVHALNRATSLEIDASLLESAA